MRFGDRRLSLMMLGVTIAAASCRPSPPGYSVLLRTDKAQYRAGETVTLTFENKSADHFTFNPCNRSIERADGSAWKPFDEPARMCTMEAWMLDAHATRSGPTELPATMASGRYRVVVRMSREPASGGTPSSVNAVSDPITIS